jgi:FtsP/CotA-like multicopper oxidase with cupredoxin domain
MFECVRCIVQADFGIQIMIREWPSMIHSRKLLAVGFGIIFIVVLVALATGMVFVPPNQPANYVPFVTVTKSTCDRPAGFVLIIADLSGFNNSISHGAPMNPWPVIRVERGQVVRLLVCNQDTTQPHGFAIANYLEPGVVMAPGDAYRIVFTATLEGTFRIYCDVFCTVHVFMVGRLIVSG